MSTLEAEIRYLKFASNFFDLIGDYEESDKSTDYLLKISNYQNQNIRLGGFNLLKTLGLQKPLNWIKEQGKKVDKWVRDKVPGGWVTVIALTLGVTGVVPGLSPQNILNQIGNLIGKGLNPLATMAQSTNPGVALVGKTMLTTLQTMAAGELTNLIAPKDSDDDSGGSAGSGFIDTSGSIRGIYDPYSGQTIMSVTDKQRLITKINITMMAYGENDKSAATLAWDGFKREVENYNKTMAKAQPENQISKSEMTQIRNNINERKNFNLQGP